LKGLSWRGLNVGDSAMSQQWFTVIGLAADVVGFCLIAIEWYRTHGHRVFVRARELGEAYERNAAREEGREPDCIMQDEEETMAGEFLKLHYSEARVRQSLYLLGLVLVVVGFLLQLIGAWPV